MLTSARNELSGKITAVRTGAVNDEIDIALNDHDVIVAIVTSESTKKLGLAPGKDITALIKASHVMLTTDKNITVSARNMLAGTISTVRNGAVNCEIDIILQGGGEIVAIVTEGSVARMGLSVGNEVGVFFKSSSVILAV